MSGNTGDTLRWRIAGSLAAVDQLCCEVRESVLGEIPYVDRFAVELLLREALTNAVQHGSQSASGGGVCCEIERFRDGVAVRIADSGEGFDWQRVLERHLDPLAETGRGMHILRKYSSALRFNDKGNCVEVIRMYSQGVSNGEL